MAVVVNTVKIVSFGSNGIEVTVLPGVAVPANTPAFLIAGSDGTDARYIRTATDGTVRVDPTGTTTQPISAASLPLPTGAAQEHTTAGSPSSVRLSDGSAFYDATKTGQLPAALTGSGNLKVAVQEALPAGTALIGKFQLRNPGNTVDLGDASNPVRIDPTGTTTQPISAASLPLPTGAATETTLATRATESSLVAQSMVDNAGFSDAVTRIVPAGFIFDETAGTALTENDGAAARIDSKRAIVFALEDESTRGRRLTITAANAAKVDGSAVTQPVSGTVTANQGTAAALSGAWPVKHTDGTNTMPTMDATARPGFVRAFGVDANNAAPTVNPVAVAGWDGTNLRILKTDDQGRVRTVSPTGTLSGFADGQIVLASSTVTAVRSTTYTEPSVGAQRSVASSNANDTSAGTGARTIRITYYTLTAGVVAGPFTEDKTLNGTTPVNTTATNICFIEKIEVLTVGSTGSNVGIITLYGSTAGGGGTVWTIAATANKTFAAHHYVPNGVTCNVTGLLLGIKGADTTGGFLRAKDPTNANAAEIQITDNLRAPSSGQNFRSYGTPIDVVGPARITAYVAPDSTSSRTYYMSFDFYEE